MMQNKMTQTTIGAVLALVLIGGGIFFINRDVAEAPVMIEEGENTIPEGLDIEGEGTIEIIPPTEDVEAQFGPIPDLTRELNIDPAYAGEIEGLLNAEKDRLVSILEVDPTDFAAWIDLGIIRKNNGDERGAEQAWIFASKLAPDNSITYSNLGNLYHFQLKEFENAEENFRIALTNNPANIHAYRSFHELYRYSYKVDTSAAVDIVLEGLEKNPGTIDLMSVLGEYYKSKRDTVNAITWYEKALNEAQNVGNFNLIDIFNTEINALKAQ